MIEGFYSNTSDFDENQDFLTFKTNNFLNEDIDEKEVGEIEITKLDWEKREIEGIFNFEAFAYHHNWKDSVSKISKVDSSMFVSEGSFYYHWDEEFEIGYSN
jgi:hypothetical protein